MIYLLCAARTSKLGTQKYEHAFPRHQPHPEPIILFTLKFIAFGTSLMAQWIGLRAPNAGGLSSIPGQGSRSHTHAATKTQRNQPTNQINK